MNDLGLLRDLLVVFALGVVVVVTFHRFGLPPIVGFLLTGIVIGPFGFRLIRAYDDVTALAEIGVILLLFTVGLQLSLRELTQMRRLVVRGGALQVGLTVAIVATIAVLLGLAWPLALFLGMLVAHSSSTIILRLVSDRGELHAPHARAALSVSIFQDLSVVPMVLAVPLLAGGGATLASAAYTIARALLFLAGALLASKYLVPFVVERVVRTRQREAFVLTLAVLCLGTAAAAAAVGLSLALGAFIAGLVLSESKYSQQALGEILPLRELFNILFFVAIGMLFDARTLLQQPMLVLGTLGATMALKAVISIGVMLALGHSVRVAILAGFLLAQVGEFSFVLSRAGVDSGLLDERLNQLFLAVAIGTMGLMPATFAIARTLAERIQMAIPARWVIRGGADAALADADRREMADHVIVVGFGLNGHNLSRVLRHHEIPFIVVEMNPELVREERARGLSFVLGDATRPEILEHAGVQRARVLVVAISDAAATRRVVDVARRMNPEIDTIVRTRYVSEIAPLLALGSTEVVPEEFETSIEIFARVLRRYLVPRDIIESAIHHVRRDGYDALRSLAAPEWDQVQVARYLSEVTLESFRVARGSALEDRTLRDSGLREQFDLTVVASRRDGETVVNPSGNHTLRANEVVTVLGRPDRMPAARALFEDSSINTQELAE